MPLIISTELKTAMDDAARIPALTAALDKMHAGSIVLYDHPNPEDPAATALVTIPLRDPAGTVSTNSTGDDVIIGDTDPALEGQVQGAATDGSVPKSARILSELGAHQITATVTVTGGGGHIEMTQTGLDAEENPEVRLFDGAFARIESIEIGIGAEQ